jgi:hypothetical protein
MVTAIMPPYAATAPRSKQTKSMRTGPAVPRVVPVLPLTYQRIQQPSPLAKSNSADADQTGTSESQLADQNRSSEAANGIEPESEITTLTSTSTLPEPGASTNSTETGNNGAIHSTSHDQEPSAESSRKYGISIEKGRLLTYDLDKGQDISDPENNNMENTADFVRPQQATAQRNPPPFHPSDNLSTPTSVASSTNGNHNNNAVTMHHPRPTTNNIVFGGYPDSSNNSPAPPASSGAVGYPPPPPVGYMQQYGHPFFPNHGHHFSEPHASMMLTPVGMPPPSNFSYGRELPPPDFRQGQQWRPADGPMPFSFGQAPVFTPGNMQHQANGIKHFSRPGSSASKGTQEQEVSAHESGAQVSPRIANGISHPPPGFNSANMAALALQDFMLAQFGNFSFADYVIEISESPNQPNLLSFPVHGVLLLRSPTLAALATTHTPATTPMAGPKVLHIHMPQSYYHKIAVTEALRFLYGGALLTSQQLTQGLSHQPVAQNDPAKFQLSQDRLAQAISYTFFGRLLGIHPIVDEGLQAIKNLLRWDNVEKALTLSLESDALSRDLSLHGNGFNMTMDDNVSNDVSPQLRPILAGFKEKLFDLIAEFIAYNIPKDFELNTNAAQLDSSPLLPTLPDNRPISHRPRLSRIQFGDLPTEAPTFVTTLLSSILLSLPFSHLKYILETNALGSRLGWERVVDVMKTVVSEREERRSRVINSKQAHRSHEPAEERLWENSRFEERIEGTSQHRSGHILVRSSPRTVSEHSVSVSNTS